MISEVMDSLADDLRRRVAKGTVVTVRRVADIDFGHCGIHIVGTAVSQRIRHTGPAIRMAMANPYRLDGDQRSITLHVLILVDDGKLRLIMVYRGKDKWHSAHDWLGTVELSAPDMLEQLAKVLGRIGINYVPKPQELL